MALSHLVAAQEHETHQISFLLGNIGIPTAQLKQAYDRVGIGLGINGLINPKRRRGYSPVFFGGDFSWYGFGRDKYKSSLSSTTYKTTFNYYGVNGLTRLFLSNKSKGFVPFIDGQMGGRILNTRTMTGNNIFKLIFDDQAELIHSTNNASLNYSLGFGFYTRKGRDENGDYRPSATLRVMYHWSNQTQYVKRGSVLLSGGSVVGYETGYTRANMITVQFGVIMY
ncbi:MAG: hypothetical protein KF803_18350 [Cyclobacteriaceae bacterium]|nr:hypothetical protein [Cyclobacteriaceae bacterium]